jgi:hypothetical protein
MQSMLAGHFNSRHFVRPVLFFSIVLCLIASGAAQTAAEIVAAKALKAVPERCENVTAMGQCHANYPAGCSLPKSGAPGYDAYLAYFKNQIPTVQPQSQGQLTLNDFARLYRDAPETLSTTNHANFSQDLLKMKEGQYFTVIGYLYYLIINTKGEASNCALKNEAASDYHLGIGFDAQLAGTAPKAPDKPPHELEANSIVVEMTPHYRAKYHPKWTSTALKKLRGRQVKVVGQLIVDNDHMKTSDICSTPPKSADDPNCWRASPWELHPVTEFYVCRAANCSVNSPDWIPLDTFDQQQGNGDSDSGSSNHQGGSSHHNHSRKEGGGK